MEVLFDFFVKLIYIIKWCLKLYVVIIDFFYVWFKIKYCDYDSIMLFCSFNCLEI